MSGRRLWGMHIPSVDVWTCGAWGAFGVMQEDGSVKRRNAEIGCV